MKVLSLFDGLAGARQALKELNIDCEYYASEIDKYAIQVAKTNHPDIVHIGDVKDLWTHKLSSYDSEDYEDGGEPIILHYGHCDKDVKSNDAWGGNFDLLIGGSPCQDLSIAKKDRKGLDGDRSSLFYEYLRILNEVKPKYFILENVASMSKAAKEAITKELFDIEPVMINSALLTAQNRKRLYWVGKLVDGEYKQVKIDQPEDQEIYLKDIIEKGKRHLVFDIISPNSPKTGLYAIAQRGRYTKDGGTEQRFETSYSEKANALTRVQKDSMLLDHYIIRKLTPTECCRLQGFPDNYVSMVSNTQGYKGLGNSFTVPVIKHIIKQLNK